MIQARKKAPRQIKSSTLHPVGLFPSRTSRRPGRRGPPFDSSLVDCTYVHTYIPRRAAHLYRPRAITSRDGGESSLAPHDSPSSPPPFRGAAGFHRRLAGIRLWSRDISQPIRPLFISLASVDKGSLLATSPRPTKQKKKHRPIKPGSYGLTELRYTDISKPAEGPDGHARHLTSSSTLYRNHHPLPTFHHPQARARHGTVRLPAHVRALVLPDAPQHTALLRLAPFSDSSSLARHRRTHTGKRPYRCPFADCQKTFTRRTTLTRHRMSHRGTIEEAAAATAAALAANRANKAKVVVGQTRSEGDQLSTQGSPLTTPSPAQRPMSLSPGMDMSGSLVRHAADFNFNAPLPAHMRMTPSPALSSHGGYNTTMGQMYYGAAAQLRRPPGTDAGLVHIA
ncbi:hypothetical protein CP532_2430 [Ophiocordyceps camponoti-leonardi (nom. inval.)]|nr:hypothetical protein CP532_2430 [Ophiocordyceps camponoti-leonardi (nom. inval.)]